MNMTLQALAEPHRFQIVELLCEGPRSVGEITASLGLDQPKVSKHLRVLSDTGLVEARAVANRRVYRLRPEPFRELEAWIENFRRITDERFDRMEDHMKELLERRNDSSD